jgi:hypothetical protein
MASFKRIYLDTIPLLQAKWPKLSSLLETVLNLAKLENVEIYLPDPVEQELEKHLIRQWTDDFENIRRRMNSSTKTLPEDVATQCSVTYPHLDTIVKAHRKAVSEVTGLWGIKTSPLTTIALYDMKMTCRAGSQPQGFSRVRLAG